MSYYSHAAHEYDIGNVMNEVKVICHRCGAGVGYACFTGSGRTRRFPHKARVILARKVRDWQKVSERSKP